MEPSRKYLTLHPSTSTSRSILAEPLEQIPGPLEQIREPLERSRAPSEQSQEPQERGLVQENRKCLEEAIERIVELKTSNTQWPEIVKAVGLPLDTCYQIWDDIRCQLARTKADPQPETSRQFKPWSKSEDEILLNLKKAGGKWHEMPAKLEGRSGNACRLRYKKLCEEAKIPLTGQTMDGDENREG